MLRRIIIEKLLLLSFCSVLVLLSCVCWGRIIVESTSAQEEVVEKEVASTATTAGQVKDNILIFSGAMVVLARYLPSNTDK